MNIREIFGHPKCTGDVAVEIEIEGDFLPKIRNDFWTVHRDGSLKSGHEALEYVMTKPIPKKELIDSLTDFQKLFEKSNVLDSFYAGTHIHVNIQELSPTELINYVCAILVTEDLLVDWCGNTRVGNHFCLRSSDAEAVLEFLKEVLRKGNINEFNTDGIRYCFYNLKSVVKYGSLEFRSLNSTIDPIRINTWAQTLLNIKEQSIKFNDPISLVEYIKEDVNRWLYKVFTLIYYTDFVKDGWEDKVIEGIYRAEEIAYSRVWNKASFNIFYEKTSHF